MKTIQGSETVRSWSCESEHVYLLTRCFPHQQWFFYSWRGHWQMKIHKNQTRASCFLIAIFNAFSQNSRWSMAAILEGRLLSSQFNLHCRYWSIFNTCFGSIFLCGGALLKLHCRKVSVFCACFESIFLCGGARREEWFPLPSPLPVDCLWPLSETRWLSELKYDVCIPWHLPWVDITDPRDIQVGLNGFFHTWGQRLGS